MKGFLSGFFFGLFSRVLVRLTQVQLFRRSEKMTQASYQNRYRTRETRGNERPSPMPSIFRAYVGFRDCISFFQGRNPKKFVEDAEISVETGFWIWGEIKKFGSTHSRSKIRESLQIKEKYLRIRRARGFLRPACSVPAWSKSLNTLNCSLKEVEKKSPAKKTC